MTTHVMPPRAEAVYVTCWGRGHARRTVLWSGKPVIDMSWMGQAVCRPEDADRFYNRPGPKQLQRAKAMCQECPVRTACLEYAVATRQRNGIWGGVGPGQLRLLQRQRGLGAVP